MKDSMKPCEACQLVLTTIEQANCGAVDCPNRDQALRGPFPKLGKTDANAPAYSMSVRERFALEAMRCRLTNEDMYKRHGCQYDSVAHDAVKWADALIDRLNGILPKQDMKPEVGN